MRACAYSCRHSDTTQPETTKRKTAKPGLAESSVHTAHADTTMIATRPRKTGLIRRSRRLMAVVMREVSPSDAGRGASYRAPLDARKTSDRVVGVRARDTRKASGRQGPDAGERGAATFDNNGAVRYAILGTTQAHRDDGTPVDVGGARLRALLTALALTPGRLRTTAR